jgi:DNA-binding helix-hairpin-helix protein with protein kinase domain
MDMHLDNGTLVDAGHLGSVRVEALLGEGGFGAVYEVSTSRGERLALKWFKPEASVPTQWESVARLLESPPPDRRFLWPLAMVGNVDDAAFGYVMPLRGSEYLTLARVANRVGPDGTPLTVTVPVLLETGRQLAEAFLRLHTQGLCYRDVSLANIFVDPGNGDVLVCDLDNVEVDDGRVGRVLGTGRFMAPEIVRRQASPSIWTDRYSLSVVLFVMLFGDHPLEGALTELGPRDDVFQLEHFGNEPLFCMHPDDARNRPVSGPVATYWDSVYPTGLKELFVQAFVAGLDDPRKRVVEGQWIRGMSRLRDVLGVCQHCHHDVFHDRQQPERPCWSCGQPLGDPLVLVHPAGHRSVIGPALRVFSGLAVQPSGSLAAGDPPLVAAGVPHPTDPTRIGLSNRSQDAWRAAYPSGEEVDVHPGSACQVVEGMRITGSGFDLEVRKGLVP